MKGIVFTEFLDLFEDKFGIAMVDKIIENADLPSGGAYTSVGTYDFAEMLSLLTNLSKFTEIDPDTLLLVYGEHFFSVIKKSYPSMLEMYKDPIEFLASIENHIHVEVRKIYPDAELPTFNVIEKTKDKLVTIYTSSRALHSFGQGLMNSSLEYYNTEAEVVKELIKEDGTEVKFIITRKN